MSKIKSLINAAVEIQRGIEELEGHGIDVNRIIGISNTQGVQAKAIHRILSEAIKLGGSYEAFETAMTSQKHRQVKSLPPKPRSKKNNSNKQ